MNPPPVEPTRRRRAATLAAVLVVCLAAVAVWLGVARQYLDVALQPCPDCGPESKVRGDLEGIRAALILYRSDNLTLPTTGQGLGALNEKPSAEPVPQRWRKYIPEPLLDPWGSVYGYRYPAVLDTGAVYDVFSPGPDRVPGTADDIGGWTPPHQHRRRS